MVPRQAQRRHLRSRGAAGGIAAVQTLGLCQPQGRLLQFALPLMHRTGMGRFATPTIPPPQCGWQSQWLVLVVAQCWGSPVLAEL